MSIASQLTDDIRCKADNRVNLGTAILNLMKGDDIEEESDEDFLTYENETKFLPFCSKTNDLQDSGFAHESNDGQSFISNDNFCSTKLLHCESSACTTPQKREAFCNSKLYEDQSPLTPTTNLKVLLHAASPEIRSYERRKLMFPCNSLTDDNDNKENTEEIKKGCQFNNCHALDGNDSNLNGATLTQCNKDSTTKSESLQTASSSTSEKLSNRKEKSLGLLCRRFLRLYPERPKENISISLDDAATKLSVGRRRIYDIINVLESIKIVVRLAKNNYSWRGRNGLTHTLREIKKEAEESGYASVLRNALSQFQEFKIFTALENSEENACTIDRVNSGNKLASSRRRDKSLGILSKKFVTLFIIQPNQPVSFEMAARVMIKQGHPSENKYKTKVRRLYDIANILTSLKLIKKVNYPGRKPSFRWIGPEISSHCSPKSSKLSSPLANIWTSPSVKLLAIDDGFSSLCEVVEQERKDLCLTTPDKTGNCSFKSPTKGENYAIITPIKRTNTLDLSSNCIELDESGNINLDSSFNRDEVFRKELESLRKRFPSPMSRLLSACNVQQAMSQHKKKKTEKLLKGFAARRNLQSASWSGKKMFASRSASSPLKIDLDYLKKQQEIISNKVGNAADSLCEESSLNTSHVNSLAVKSNSVTQNKQAPPFSSKRTPIPMSRIKIINSSKILHDSKRKLSPLKSCQTSTNNKFPVILQKNVHSVKVPALFGTDSEQQILKLKSAHGCLQPQKNKGVKVLFNPSNNTSMSRFSTCTNHDKKDDTDACQKSVKLFKVKLTGQSHLAQSAASTAQQNFVKVDLPNLSASKQHSTLFKRVSKLTRRNSSVVTNLVTRLEQQGYSKSKDDLLLSKRIASVDDLSKTGHVKILQPLPKRKKLEFSDEQSKRCGFDSNVTSDWINDRSYFRPLSNGTIQTSTPRVPSKFASKNNNCACFIGCSTQNDEGIVYEHKNNFQLASHSLSSTPVSFQSSSRPASSCEFMFDSDAALTFERDLSQESCSLSGKDVFLCRSGCYNNDI